MLRAGLIGVSSSGKTTLFQLLTRRSADGQTGTRQDASVGLALVPDPRLDRLAELYSPRKRTPATVTFVDLAARPTTGADLSVAERRIERLEKDRRKGIAKDQGAELDLLRRAAEALEAGTPLRSLEFDGAAARLLRGFQFLSAKPLLLVLNGDEADAAVATETAVRAAGLDDFLGRPGVRALSVCAKIELEIAELDPADATAFLADLGLRGTGLDRVIRATYELLGYISFFTAGEDECRAWSVAAGTRAQDAAGEIHTDMARGFIRAEVVPCDPLLARGSLAECRKHAEVRLEGKDYVIRDGDVINVRFAT